jgi:hypothetical protein
MDDVQVTDPVEAEAPPGCGGEVCEAPAEAVAETVEEVPSEPVVETEVLAPA